MTDREDSTASTAEVVRSEERLLAATESHVTETVRIGKRVVTEERTVTVTVRREELYVERSAGAGTAAEESAGTSGADGRDGAAPVLTVTLSEEEPVVTTRTVPREVVRVYVDRVTGEAELSDDVAREVVEVDVDGRADGTGAGDRSAEPQR
ncbi:YsnF/AvaK domain-containing protein [uncultured Cellulomonas sp.]|uniref:YsnF/AvaK domain-containing protein n=1 Tax=uncultured Cellulomonas sp. TaxID=189682 RepID=UPI002609C691|nr:YsnF/AvaK domain-containing protein [uncultured Cellulomonas sp.]